MHRGEVWWAELPTSGRRPACVLTRETAIPLLNQVLVVPATRTIRGLPSEVRLGVDDGMPDECVLAFDNVTAVPKWGLTRRITRLSSRQMAEVCVALAAATECAASPL